MPRATPIPTGTSAPTPTGRWPIATATTSSARSTPTGRSTRSSANNWPATSWPAIVAGRDATPATIDQLVATHFLRNGQDGTGESDGNPDEVRADKYAVLEGAIQIIGSSLLGLTLQCAKCHDHKFEPVTQKEYYQLQAILYPAFNVEHWVKPNDRMVIAGPRDELLRWEVHEKAIDAEIEALKRTFAAGPDAAKKKEEALKPVIEAVERPAAAEPRPDRLGRRCLGRPGRDPAPGPGQSRHAGPEGRARAFPPS